MKKILDTLLRTRDEVGITETMVQCSNGCIMSKDMLIVIRIKKRTITRCPYCNSTKFKTV